MYILLLLQTNQNASNIYYHLVRNLQLHHQESI